MTDSEQRIFDYLEGLERIYRKHADLTIETGKLLGKMKGKHPERIAETLKKNTSELKEIDKAAKELTPPSSLVVLHGLYMQILEYHKMFYALCGTSELDETRLHQCLASLQLVISTSREFIGEKERARAMLAGG